MPEITQEASIYLPYLNQLNVAVPRYTSYPTAADWGAISYQEVLKAVSSLDANMPVSLYVHIPFCRSMCLYCGCSVVLNRDPCKEERYVQALCKEIYLVSSQYKKKLPVLQLHFGGGTPTKLTIDRLQRIVGTIRDCFEILPQAEIAIEIDPRSVKEDNFSKLRALPSIGFNRVSFGVQDTNEDVQEAVKRRQSLEITLKAFQTARDLGFSGINIDLIYGLPLQTRATFRDTIHTIGEEFRPERIALFSYAKVPWVKPHQKAIPDRLLPSTEEKFFMYMYAREALSGMGYTPIGMDHFAHASDPISERFKTRTLRRNFQGYTVLDCSTMIGFGMTAISDLPVGYFQNSKTLQEYYQAIEERHELPLKHGKLVTNDDRIRRGVIEELMCHFCLDLNRIDQKWNIDSMEYFSSSFKQLQWFEEEQFIVFDRREKKILVEPKGELFIRNIASCFDKYYQALTSREGRYSKAV